MDVEAKAEQERPETLPDHAFRLTETSAYLILGFLLALATVLSICSAGASLWTAIVKLGAPDLVASAIDRLLFVFMLVEILHTVRVSFRTGVLVCEPFLIVGLIASIRRVLVITLKSSASTQGGNVAPESQAMLISTMLELGVLGGLILIMVVSIFMLRRSEQMKERTSA